MFRTKTSDLYAKLLFAKNTIVLFVSIIFFGTFFILFSVNESSFVITNYYYLIITPIAFILLIEILVLIYKKTVLKNKEKRELRRIINETSIGKNNEKVLCVFDINKFDDWNHILDSQKQTYKNIEYIIYSKTNNKEISIFSENQKIKICRDLSELSKNQFDYICLVSKKMTSTYVEDNLKLFNSKQAARLGYINQDNKNIFINKELFFKNNDESDLFNFCKKDGQKYLWFGLSYPQSNNIS